MSETQDKNVSGQKRRSKGKSKDRKNAKNLDEGDKTRVQESTVTDKLVDPVEKAFKTVLKGNVTSATNISALKENEANTDQTSSDINKKSTKSREEILAEREAKKLAKQALKKKAKEGKVEKENKQETLNESKSNGISQEGKESCESSKEVSKAKTGTAPVIDLRNQSVESVDKIKNEGKSKAQLRAERRAIQEAQRAKKLKKEEQVSENTSKASLKPDELNLKKAVVKEHKVTQPSQDKIHKVKLFAHLYRELFDCVEMNLNEDIHPSVIRLGTQYRSKVISGANARCLALLNTFKTVVQDYKTPQNQEFSRGLEGEISKSMAFLNKCRPVAVSMINAIKQLKFQVNQLKGDEIKSKKQINDWIDTYIKEQIEKASEAISLFVLQKITDGDVVLTYSCSSLIQRTLIKANEANIKFRVIVADGRPWLEGKEMLRRLVKAGISCTYVLFNGLSFIMPEVTKVLLGAHALLANGYVMSRAGSSQIALLAKTYNVPVLVCCETHKFSEKVQTDSFVHNELGDPDELISNKGSNSKELSKWKTMQYLTPLNLTYDVTPPDLVSAVVTEIAVLPCTSVPVILRVKPQDLTC